MKGFEDHTAPHGGYYQENKEEEFPWDSTDRSVWFALFIVEGGEIKKYGFTSSKSQKHALLEALRELPHDCNAELLGVWNGRYSTSLICLDIDISISKLSMVT